MDPLARVRTYLDRLLSRPVAELSRAQRFLRFAVDLARHASRELRQDQAGQMAAALTYRTIFSLVPLTMLSMLAFRMFGDMEGALRWLQTEVYGLFDTPVGGGASDAQLFRAELDRQLEAIVRSVTSLDYQAIGGVGLLLLVWAALGLFFSFEQSANRIYRAPQGRSTLRRIVLYWTVATLGPLVLFVALWLAELVLAAARAVPWLGPAFQTIAWLKPVAASALLLLAVYKLIPNTAVRWRPAAEGAVVAALLGELSRRAFALYVNKALPYLSLYGAIGLIPLFLLWLYLFWLIVLFGLEIAFTLQTMRGRGFDRVDEDKGRRPGDPQWLVPLLAAIAQGFARHEPPGRQELADRLGLGAEMVAELAGRLKEAGLVHQVLRRGSEEPVFTMALPPERIRLAELVDLGFRLSLGDEPRPGEPWRFVSSCRDAARAAAGERTLASLIGPEA